jgi:hypothetical protein
MMDFSQLAVSIDTQRSSGIVMIRPHIEPPPANVAVPLDRAPTQPQLS